MLAEAGYTAIAVDMYGHGKVADHPDNAKAFMEQALENPQAMNQRFNAAKAVLAAQEGVNSSRIFAVGYCFGGAVVLNQARMGADLAGVASFHGSLGSDIKPQPGDVKARILVAHGAADPMVPAETVATFMQDMMKAGTNLTFISYRGVTHGFTNPGATEKGNKYNLPLAYDADADKDSWNALMRFIAGE
jgi:dienelactone hydrolase